MLKVNELKEEIKLCMEKNSENAEKFIVHYGHTPSRDALTVKIYVKRVGQAIMERIDVFPTHEGWVVLELMFKELQFTGNPYAGYEKKIIN